MCGSGAKVLECWMAAADEPSCRVCFGQSSDSSGKKLSSENDMDGDLGKLIRVCACSGSIALIHEGCLRRWILVSSNPIDRRRCPQCRTKYLTQRRRLGLALTVAKWGCAVACAAILHLVIFASAMPWASGCFPNRWYGKLTHIPDLSVKWSMSATQANLLYPLMSARQNMHSKLLGHSDSLVHEGTPTMGTSHVNSVFGLEWWDIPTKSAMWALLKRDELQWHMVAVPRPPPSLWQGGALDFTLGGTLFRFSLTGSKRNTYSAECTGKYDAGNRDEPNLSTRPSSSSSSTTTAPSSHETKLGMDQGVHSDRNMDIPKAANAMSGSTDSTVSNLFLRVFHFVLGGHDRVDSNQQGRKRPRQPRRTNAPLREPTDPLSMAAAAAMATARSQSKDIMAQNHLFAAYDSIKATSTVHSRAESMASSTNSPSKDRDEVKKGARKGKAKDDSKIASSLVDSQEVLEIGVLDVLELLMSVGPFDLVVGATVALVATAHTDRVASASAAAASSIRRRVKFKDTVAAAMEAKQTVDTGVSLQDGDRSALPQLESKLKTSTVADDVIASSSTKVPSSCDTACIKKYSDVGTRSGSDSCDYKNVEDNNIFNEQIESAPYGMHDICQRVGMWEWSGALIYGTIMAGTTWCMLVLTLGPSLAAFVAIFRRGRSTKNWSFVLLWACLAACWFITSNSEDGILRIRAIFSLSAIVIAGLAVEVTIIAYSVEELAFYFARNTSWGLRQIEVMERPSD